MKQLAEVLLQAGEVTAEQLATAAAAQRYRRLSLGSALVELGMVSEPRLVEMLAISLGLRAVDLSAGPADPLAVGRVPEQLCRRHTLVPIGFEGDRIVVAMADPADVVAVDDVRSATGLDVRVVVAARTDVLAAIARSCRDDTELDDLSVAMSDGQPSDADVPLSGADVDDAPVVKFVNLLIQQAIADRASDIHLEPGERELRVRFRIDGVLHEVMRSPRAVSAGVTSRLKIMSDLDIAERRIPQDGRLSVVASGRRIDLRVATLPTVWGEKIVLRVLDSSSALLGLADLGFTPANAELWARGFRRPHGMVLVTGPTGSGKSTTLYATLGEVSRPEVNVITVEDPVEYRLPGINQVQTHAKAGLTFAAALRSILRCDPDVVLLGEVRDAETAQIAVEAALTGHLVLSTLHTNDAPSALTRLTEMGLEPFLVGSALACVLAQRLARRLCTRCALPWVPPAEQLAEVAGAGADVGGRFLRPVGCGACAGTGYRGRLALHEVMAVSEQVERLAVSRASATDISRLAREEGMTTLRADGMAKAEAGLTSVEEVLRVTG